MGKLAKVGVGLVMVGKATGSGISNALKKLEDYNAAEPERIDAAKKREEEKLKLTLKKEKLAKLKAKNAPKSTTPSFDIWKI